MLVSAVLSVQIVSFISVHVTLVFRYELFCFSVL
jgi:hypothetical protein